jgi:hypothetical protein
MQALVTNSVFLFFITAMETVMVVVLLVHIIWGFATGKVQRVTKKYNWGHSQEGNGYAPKWWARMVVLGILTVGIFYFDMKFVSTGGSPRFTAVLDFVLKRTH